ncbi:MAG: Ig domain-containing protein, partial [Casimicrobiaceae bacterium]
MGTSRGAMCRLALGMLVLGAAAFVAGPAAAQVVTFSAAKTFAPPTINSGNPTTLTIRLQNTDKVRAASAISFTDNFPAGMVLVPGDPAFQCGGNLGFVANAFTFANGTVPPASFCDVLVTVTAKSPTNLTLTNTTSTISFSYVGAVGSIPGVTGVLNVTGGIPPAITSAPPPGGQIGVAYDYAVTVFGTAPIAVTVSGLPPGLSFSPATLHITGIPTTVGAFAGTITAINGFLPNAVQNFTINIQPPPLTIVTPPASIAPPVLIGTPIDVTLQAVGGSPPYVWTVVGGALPPGVTLALDGHLTGEPTAAGTYTFVVQVNDALGRSTTQTYILDIVKIAAALTFTVTPKPVISGQTMTVAAAVAPAGAVVATGTIEVY